jgi:hypothetical protein
LSRDALESAVFGLFEASLRCLFRNPKPNIVVTHFPEFLTLQEGDNKGEYLRMASC